MKQTVISEGSLSWAEGPPRPEPGYDEIVIQVHAAGVNRADLLQARGLYPPPRGVSPVLGLECAGVVRRRGAGVTGVAVGDPVMALLRGGGYAEEVTASPGEVLPIPHGWSFAQAASFMEAAVTAHLNLVALGALRPGGWALVHGAAGGVGLAAIQVCRAMGAHAIAGSRDTHRRRQLLAHGAAAVFDPSAEDWPMTVRSSTPQEAGIDVVLDCLGAESLEGNLACLADGGTLVVIGLMRGRQATLDMAALLSRRLRIVGSTLRNLPLGARRDAVQAMWNALGPVVQTGQYHLPPHREFPIQQAGEAHRLLAASEIFGKAVLTVL